ncbi:MAG: hypothetical protein ACLQAH_03490 [Limisphaerales bacterium]
MGNGQFWKICIEPHHGHGKIVMGRAPVALPIGRMGLVVIIEGDNVPLVERTGKNIECRSVVSPIQLVDKTKLDGQHRIFPRVEIQSQPSCQLEQCLLSFAGARRAPNGVYRGDYADQHHNRDPYWSDVRGVVHAVVLNQSAMPGHYNFGRFLHTRFSFSPFPFGFILTA